MVYHYRHLDTDSTISHAFFCFILARTYNFVITGRPLLLSDSSICYLDFEDVGVGKVPVSRCSRSLQGKASIDVMQVSSLPGTT